MPKLADIPGLPELWSQTQGDDRLTLAVLDGPVDVDRACFQGAALTQVSPHWQEAQTIPPEALDAYLAIDHSGLSDLEKAAQERQAIPDPQIRSRIHLTAHATHVASLLVGQPGSPVVGIAPRCKVVNIPIAYDEANFLNPIHLCHAISLALEKGAHVIHIAACHPTQTGLAHELLDKVLRQCWERNVLIVAPAGNDGGQCWCLPAVLPGVLAVGAMNDAGEPFQFSNWGGTYQDQGILAPGENIWGAQPGTDRPVRRKGTSCAAPIVTGIAALLLSLQRQQGATPDAEAIRAALLYSAIPCDSSEIDEPERCLAGKLNIAGAYELLQGKPLVMASTQGSVETSGQISEPAPGPISVRVLVNSTEENNNNVVENNTQKNNAQDVLENNVLENNVLEDFLENDALENNVLEDLLENDALENRAQSALEDGTELTAVVNNDRQLVLKNSTQQILENGTETTVIHNGTQQILENDVETTVQENNTPQVLVNDTEIAVLENDSQYHHLLEKDSQRLLENHVLENHTLTNHVLENHVPKNHVPKNHVLENHVPENDTQTVLRSHDNTPYVLENAQQILEILESRTQALADLIAHQIPDHSRSFVHPTSSNQILPSAISNLVYVLGSLGYDFGSEARRDSFKQLMPGVEREGTLVPANPYDARQMVDYLEQNLAETRALIWTLNLELIPVYALEAVGPFAAEIYGIFQQLLAGQIEAETSEFYIERVSIPGRLTPRTVRLFSGQILPVVEVEGVRGIYGWPVNRLVDAAIASLNTPTEPVSETLIRQSLTQFLNRVYYDLRNLGKLAKERALNFAATNALQAAMTFRAAIAAGLQLDSIEVEKSPYCRLHSDCWDVKLRFFDPENQDRAKQVFRFTIDVVDVLPVTLGEVRSWWVSE